MRIPRSRGLEPQVALSISRYRTRCLIVRAAAATPLIAAVVATLLIYIHSLVRDVDRPAVAAHSLVFLAVVAAMLLLGALFIGPEKIPLVPPSDRARFTVFQNALEEVSIAAGTGCPDLLVLDVPTVNSLCLYHNRRQAVGVTAEALEAGLSRRCAEAMMAHEMSHVLMGDVVAGQNTLMWRLVGVSLVLASVLPWVFLTFAMGSSAWVYLGFLFWLALTAGLLTVMGRLLTRQNNLLADSIAAKITGDPGAIREVLLLLEEMFSRNPRPFAPGARYPGLMFIYQVRPEVDVAAFEEQLADEDDAVRRDIQKRQHLKKLHRRRAYSRATTRERIENLEAIERGHWAVFEG